MKNSINNLRIALTGRELLSANQLSAIKGGGGEDIRSKLSLAKSTAATTSAATTSAATATVATAKVATAPATTTTTTTVAAVTKA